MACEMVEEEVATSCTLDGFTDSVEAKQLIQQLYEVEEIELDDARVERSYDQFKLIADKYQEQPHLLDPHLAWLLGELTAVGMSKQAVMTMRHQAFKYLTLLTKTRGYKIVVRQLPHEVSDMEPVLRFLMQQDPQDRRTWETRYMLLLWLSIIVIIPFHLSRFDTLATDASSKKPLAERLLDVAKSYLDKSDKTQSAAAYLVAKFVTRPDAQRSFLPQFLDWSIVTMMKEEKNVYAMTRIIRGILIALGLIYKHGKRDDILPYSKTTLAGICEPKFMQSTDSQLRKLFIKALQRIGLTFLKPRLASWRYQRGMRSLASNLGAVETVNPEIIANNTKDEDYDVPEEIEVIIEKLMSGLRDTDTIVRWSAAKGVGRVTGRLPKDLADEVVESILDIFTLRENDDAWHGGCLALAELGRRGLLLPQRLETVVPIILKALIYDVQRGNFSVGSTIRDSACYVCWSFARAYDPCELIPYVTTIATSLIIATIFDREVNCRRAAAAAFQENVGRQGTFPHGIDILTAADYFSVGSRSNCYLNLSVFIAQFPEYTKSLIDHLLDRKLNHWDASIRELAAKALHNLTACDVDYMIATILPQLVKLVENIDLATRHGAVLALGEVAHAIAIHVGAKDKKLEDVLNAEILTAIENIVPSFQVRKMFRGMGGEIMRLAVVVLIEKLSLAMWPISFSALDIYQQVLDESLAYNSPAIQLSASNALNYFCGQYYQSQGMKVEMMIKGYLQQLQASSELTRIGFAQALGRLPKFSVAPFVKEIVSALENCCEIRQPEQKDWTELRRVSVSALASVCKNVAFEPVGDCNQFIIAGDFYTMTRCCLNGMNDYTTTNRGDVGASVREASMTSLKEMLLLAVELNSKLITANLVECFMAALAQQAQEKIDRTRGHAIKIFLSMLYSNPVLPFIPRHKELIELFPEEVCQSLDCKAPGVTFPLFVKLLAFPEYTYNVLLGLTVSVGGNVESLVKHSSASICSFIKSILDQENELQRLGDVLLEVFRSHQKIHRVSLPFMNMMDQLLTSGLLSALVQNPERNFALSLADLVKTEVNKSKDLVKVIAAISVYCGLLQSHEKVRQRALIYLVIYLCHQYPRVRKEAADKLYEALLTYGDTICNEENIDEVSNHLTDTLWDQPVDTIRPIRNKLCCLLDIPVPKLIKKNDS